MKEYIAENISQFLEQVNEIQNKWNWDEIWFRGVENTNFKLLPSLYRGKYKIDLEEEQELFGQFIRKAKAFISDYQKLRPIDWYIIMQHYGFPTRLLDWTSGSLIALYFAVRNVQSNHGSCVYLIDPFEINKIFRQISLQLRTIK